MGGSVDATGCYGTCVFFRHIDWFDIAGPSGETGAGLIQMEGLVIRGGVQDEVAAILDWPCTEMYWLPDVAAHLLLRGNASYLQRRRYL